MENLNLIDTFSEFKELKNIDRATMMSVLEDVFRSLLKKKFDTDENFDIIINIDKGDFEIWRNREVVNDDEFEDKNLQIPLSEALKIDTDYEVGEEVTDEVKLLDFGRRAILSLRQNLTSRILELEKSNVFQKYKDRIGEIVTGEVYQVWKKEILILDDEGNELLLPKTEQIPSDFFRKGDTLRAVVIKVEMRNNNPIILLSRTSPVFLERLFELEVPEIFDGLITIKKIVRVPGERAKVAVESQDQRIDAVGACVGMKGVRIHAIVRELNNENIDVINYSEDPVTYIQRALAPAKLKQIEIDEEDKKCTVVADSDQVSLIVGKNGVNIRLAMKLTGYDIDVIREEKPFEEYEDDIELVDLKEELGGEIVELLINNRYDTAVEVLSAGVEKLKEINELDNEKAEEIIEVIKNQFEEEE